MPDEAAWIRRVQRDGDRDAAGALVAAYYPELGRYVTRQLADSSEALDVTQEVFVAALAHIDAFDPRRASFRTWLYRIATNKVIDRQRARRRRLDFEAPLTDEDPASGVDVDGLVVGRELAGFLRRYLAGLDPRSQQVLRLRLFGDASFAECAATLGVPESTVKSTYYRQLSLLREELRNADLV